MGAADDIQSHAASLFRGWRGVFAKPRQRAAEPEKRLEVYEFEA